MSKKLTKSISLTLSVIILSSCILFSSIPNVNAVSVKCGISITDGIYGNLSEASLPQGVHEFYTDDSPIFIFAVDADLRITKLDLYIYRGGSLYGHKSAPINNYIRFWNMTDYNSLPSGSYTYKYVYDIDGYNTSNSGEIAFTVYDRPYITSSPSSKQVKSGNVASFSVSASGGKTSSYSYKWYYSTTSSGSGTSISGATSSTYSVSASSSNSGRYYYCVVSDGERSVTSSRALLTTTYTISYNANGGSGAPSSQTKLHGTTLTLSSVKPTRTGYAFLGWSTSSSATSASYSSGGSFSQNANTTLYAVWKDNTLPSGSITSTNDISNSQTVTLKFSDNVGIAGYYWGTNSSYSNNTYTSTSSSSVSKSISEPGTYYLTVKDTSGNVSASQSITFYRTTLNGNGTTLSTTSVLTKSGNSFTPFPPFLSGYSFEGWSTSKYSSTGVTSIKPTSNTTYYAIWKDTTLPTGLITSTNNLADSQTVTLSLSDNDEVSGYYWGTSSSYSNNTYTSTSISNVIKTISVPGTYYLTVKDKSGNVSSSKSITFYETKLDANGGTVYPTSVLTMSGNSFYLPTPTRNGYTFTGWSTNALATSGEKYLITPHCSDTYFAIWKMDEAIDQTISLPSTSYTKTYGDKPFNLNTSAKTSLQYSSSNTKVATVSSAGTVTIKGSGSATITIIALSDEQYNSSVKTVKITVNKAAQKITAKSFTKTYGSKAFSLGVKSSGDGKLTYSFSDKKVATVSSKGVVTVKGCGQATITINAYETSNYKSASKKVTITVKPAKLKIKTFKGNKKVLKIYYTKQNNADGYQCVYSQGSRKITTTSKKDYVTIKNLTKGTYVVKIRAYKKLSGTVVYGEFGKIQLTVG